MKAINWNDADRGVTFEYEDIPKRLRRTRQRMAPEVEVAAEASEG